MRIYYKRAESGTGKEIAFDVSVLCAPSHFHAKKKKVIAIQEQQRKIFNLAEDNTD